MLSPTISASNDCLIFYLLFVCVCECLNCPHGITLLVNHMNQRNMSLTVFKKSTSGSSYQYHRVQELLLQIQIKEHSQNLSKNHSSQYLFFLRNNGNIHDNTFSHLNCTPFFIFYFLFFFPWVDLIIYCLNKGTIFFRKRKKKILLIIY